MELKQYFHIAKQWAWLLILGLILGTGAGYGASMYQDQVFQSSTRVMVSRAPDQSMSDIGVSSDRQLAQTYIQLLTTQPVLEATSQTLGYAVKAEQIQAQLINDTQLIRVTVKADTPQQAADIANTLVTVLILNNEQIQASRFTSSEESLQVQLKDVEKQIALLQAQIANASTEALNNQKANVTTQIEQIQQEMILVQNEITAINPPRPSIPNDTFVLSPEQTNLLKEKELRLELLKSQMQFYQDIFLNLGENGSSQTAVSQPELEQLRSNLNLYQQIYSNLLSSYEAVRLSRLTNTPNVYQVERAPLNPAPIQPRPMTNAGLGGAVGLMIAAGIIFLIEYLNDTVKTPEEVSELFGLSVIGYIPEFKKAKETEEVITADEPRSPTAEAFRILRTNIEFSSIDKPLRIIAVTSPNPGEGKTTIAANIATTFAQSSKKVILVDADLRRPRLHRFLAVNNRVGLSDIFIKNRTIQAISRPWRDSQLSYITSGSLPPNPTELLASQKMLHFLDNLKELYDVVVIDTPPIIVSDAAVIATRVDGVVIVVDPGHTKRDALRATVDQLQKVGAHITGVVFNRIPKGHSEFYGAYSHYSKYYSKGYSSYYTSDDKEADGVVN